MAGKWVSRKIGSLGRVVTGKTPSTADSSNFGGPYPFITIPDLDGRVFIDRSERTLSDQGADALHTCLLPPGAVMMSCIATIGRCGVTTRPSFTNQQINSVIPRDNADSRFLYYVFTQLGHELESAGGGGSVYTNVSKSRFSDIEIVIPEDLDEQRAIAHILGTLDDKMELNRQMSETLEAMARALFKSWFVDFDPARAKAEGRDPGLPKFIASLFPDRLVNSELSEIPEGWEVVSFAQTIDVVGGGTPKTSVPEYWNGEIPWFSVADAPHDSEIWVLATEKTITPAGLENSSTRILPEGTTIISARGTVGRVALVGVPMAMNQSCYGLRGKHDERGFYTYFSTRTLLVKLQQHTHGSVFDTITRDTLKGLMVAWASRSIIRAFEKGVAPFVDRIRHCLRESRTLAALRDALLPKLVSGEIRVKDAERFLEKRGL